MFQPLCQAVALRVAVASGKGPLSAEADALVELQGGDASSCVDVLVVTPGRCGARSLASHMLRADTRARRPPQPRGAHAQHGGLYAAACAVPGRG